MTTRNLEPDQWRNREKWRLVSGRRRQMLEKPDRQIDFNTCTVHLLLFRIITNKGRIINITVHVTAVCLCTRQTSTTVASTLGLYEVESTENLKIAIKFRNTTQLSCKFDNNDTDGLKSGRQVAVRCRYATRRRSSSVKLASPLATYAKEEQRPVTRILSTEGLKPIKIHRRMKVQCGDACLSLQQVYEWTRKFMNSIRKIIA